MEHGIDSLVVKPRGMHLPFKNVVSNILLLIIRVPSLPPPPMLVNELCLGVHFDFLKQGLMQQSGNVYEEGVHRYNHIMIRIQEKRAQLS
jgi:hypothetical protein